MKLQPHHIFPYAAYGLKIVTQFGVDVPKDGHVYTVCGVAFKSDRFETPINKEGLMFEVKEKPGKEMSQRYFEFKPMLRPLDLTKPITVDGIEIVPIVAILHEYNSLLAGGEPYTEKDLSKNPMYWEYWAVEKLFQWHFDVFGLIEQGLAVELT